MLGFAYWLYTNVKSGKCFIRWETTSSLLCQWPVTSINLNPTVSYCIIEQQLWQGQQSLMGPPEGKEQSEDHFIGINSFLVPAFLAWLKGDHFNIFQSACVGQPEVRNETEWNGILEIIGTSWKTLSVPRYLSAVIDFLQRFLQVAEVTLLKYSHVHVG